MSLPGLEGARAVSRQRGRSRTASNFSFALLAAVFLVLSTSLAAGVAHQLHQMSRGDALAVRPKYLVLIVLDGAEPGYFREGNLPNLTALGSSGIIYDRAWAGILESETPSGHATISTGSTPARDGLLGFNWIKSNNEPVRLFDPNLVRQGAMEKVMEQAGAPSIASLFKSRFPHARVVALSGHKYYAADPLGGPAADYIMYYQPDSKNHYVPMAIPNHVPPASVLTGPNLTTSTPTLPPGVEDTLAINLALNTFWKARPQVIMINIPEFDWPIGHIYGGDPAHVKVLMQDFDRDLGRLESAYKRAGVLDQTLFVITADHGMAPMKYQIPASVLDNSVTRAGTTSPETTYTTAGYVWLQDPTKAQAVATNILAYKDPHIQSVYYRVTDKSGDRYVYGGGQSISSRTDAANQYLLSSFLGGNAPDVVAFCTENATFLLHGAENWKGNHGGGSWESQHVPLLIAGPGVTSGATSHAPARLEDVAPTVLAMMGVKPAGMQGSVLADALQNPTDAEKSTQAALNQQLTPLVNALRTQSRQEIAAEAR